MPRQTQSAKRLDICLCSLCGCLSFSLGENIPDLEVLVVSLSKLGCGDRQLCRHQLEANGHLGGDLHSNAGLSWQADHVTGFITEAHIIVRPEQPLHNMLIAHNAAWPWSGFL